MGANIQIKETITTLSEFEVDSITDFNIYNTDCDVEIVFRDFSIKCTVYCNVELWTEADASTGLRAEYVLSNTSYLFVKVTDESNEELNLSNDLTKEWQHELETYLSHLVDEF